MEMSNLEMNFPRSLICMFVCGSFYLFLSVSEDVFF